jgi:hypothetical protein
MLIFIKFRSFRVPRIQIQLNLAQICFLNFNSNSVLNFEKLQWGMLLLIQFPTIPYFILNCSSNIRPSFDRIHSNRFQKHLINSEPTLCVRAGPPAASPVPAPWRAIVKSPSVTGSACPIAAPRWTPLPLPQRCSLPLLKLTPSQSFFKIFSPPHAWALHSLQSSTPKRPKATPLHPKGVLSTPADKAPLTTLVSAVAFPHHRRWSWRPPILALPPKFLGRRHRWPLPVQVATPITARSAASTPLQPPPRAPSPPTISGPPHPRCCKMEPPSSSRCRWSAASPPVEPAHPAPPWPSVAVLWGRNRAKPWPKRATWPSGGWPAGGNLAHRSNLLFL